LKKTSLFRLLSRQLPARHRTFLKGLWLFLFDGFSYRAHCDYLFTDERLKYVHILESINYTRVAGIPSVYFEFGCHSARTFAAAVRASRYFRLNNFKFFAFDSFQGLPSTNQVDDGTFSTGTFATGIDEFLSLVHQFSGLRLSRQNIVQGFYSESLTLELQKRMPKAGVIHIDVDLYSSTVEVLRFVKPLMVVGTVLLFDDWYCFSPGIPKGESLALQEFCLENPRFSIQEWKTYSTFGKSFFVTGLP
jgi:O-methyltransferase